MGALEILMFSGIKMHRLPSIHPIFKALKLLVMTAKVWLISGI